MEIPMKKIKNQRMELFLLSGMPGSYHQRRIQENWNDGTLSGMAIAIESASSGTIPAPLFKLVVVLVNGSRDCK